MQALCRPRLRHMSRRNRQAIGPICGTPAPKAPVTATARPCRQRRSQLRSLGAQRGNTRGGKRSSAPTLWRAWHCRAGRSQGIEPAVSVSKSARGFGLLATQSASGWASCAQICQRELASQSCRREPAHSLNRAVVCDRFPHLWPQQRAGSRGGSDDTGACNSVMQRPPPLRRHLLYRRRRRSL